MHVLGATALERTICASDGIAGVVATHGSSPEVDPEEWPTARYLVVWGWNPLSTAPHLWRLLLSARRAGAHLVVIDPYRSRTARVADEHVRPVPGTDGALALGMMRAIVDAGLADDEWCREYTLGYDELLERLQEYPVERCAGICGVEPETIARLGRDVATVQPSLVRLGVGAQRHLGAPIAYRTIACLPALAGSWRHRGGGLSYIPLATADALDATGLRRSDLLPGPVRTINLARQAAAQPTPYVVVHPDDAAPRGIDSGALVRVFNDRGSFVADALVTEDVRPGVAVAPMGWWNRSWHGGQSCQATTPQLLTRLTPAPTFNDNRVEIEAHPSGS